MLKDFIFSFTTTNPDTTPPAVVSTDPADSSTGAKATDPITVTFNEAVQINPLSINATTFYLDSGVTGSVTWDPANQDGLVYTFQGPGFLPQVHRNGHHGRQEPRRGPHGCRFYLFVPYQWGAERTGSLSAGGRCDRGRLTRAIPVGKVQGPDGEPVTYHLWYCTNPGFLGCTPKDVTETGALAASSSLRSTLAGLGELRRGLAPRWVCDCGRCEVPEEDILLHRGSGDFRDGGNCMRQ